jgi:hypothetical protein
MVRTTKIWVLLVSGGLLLGACDDRLACADAAVYIRYFNGELRDGRYEGCVPAIGIRRTVTESCQPDGGALTANVEPPSGPLDSVYLAGTSAAWYLTPSSDFIVSVTTSTSSGYHGSIEPCPFRVTRRGSNAYDQVEAELVGPCIVQRPVPLDPPHTINPIEVDEIVFRAPLLPYRAEDLPAGCEHLLDE